MKPEDKQRRVGARRLKRDRLVGKCDEALKRKVTRGARDFGLDESKLVRMSAEYVVDSLRQGQVIVLNGELVPASAAPTQPKPTGTEG